MNLSSFVAGIPALFAQAAPAPEAAAQPHWFEMYGPFLLVGLIIMLYFTLVAGPSRRERAQQSARLQRLKKNDEVVTIGGICGTVANVQQGSDRVTLRVDEGTGAKITVLRSAISKVVTDDEPSKKDVKSDA